MDVVGVGRVGRWLARTKILRKRQRAFASESALRRWTAGRAMRLREIPCLTPGGVRPLPPDTLPPAAGAPVRPPSPTTFSYPPTRYTSVHRVRVVLVPSSSVTVSVHVVLR